MANTTTIEQGAADEPGAALRLERDRFVAFAFAAADLLMEVDAEGRVHYAMGAAKSLTGLDTKALEGTAFREIVAAADRGLAARMVGELKPGGRLTPLGINLAQGRGMAILGACRLPAGDGRCYVTLGMARLPFAAAAQATKRDPATGLVAGEDFAKLVGNCMTAGREAGQDLKLTLLELPGLAGLKERAGDDVYGRFLSDLGGLMRSRALGGEAASALAEGKFGIVHDGSLSAAGLTGEVEGLSQRADPTGKGVAAASVDLALDDKALSPEDAGKALTYALRQFTEDASGKFAVANLGQALRGVMDETVKRIARFKDTLDRRRFDLAFQPIVALTDGRLHHYEVLSRFEERDSTASVIAFAEEIGVIHDFDLAVCQRSVEVMLKREEIGAPVALAVNVSGKSLLNQLFLGALRQLMAGLGPLRRRLLFEVTESSKITDLETARNVVQQLKTDGHQVCLDDFGAGSASFPYLQALPIDYVKIDGAYVRQAQNATRDQAILKAISLLCRDLKIGTIAEMVETTEQHKLLQGLGIGYGQGWLFGRPQTRLPAPIAHPPETARGSGLLAPGVRRVE